MHCRSKNPTRDAAMRIIVIGGTGLIGKKAKTISCGNI